MRTLSSQHARDIFTTIYESRGFYRRSKANVESISGDGSSLRETVIIRRQLPKLAATFGIESLLDAPCGDFWWMKEIAGTFKTYIGMDIVAELIAKNSAMYSGPGIQFMVADIITDPLIKMDAILCRDCLIHLPTTYIMAALHNFKRSGATFLWLTNDAGVETYGDIAMGNWRPINFRIAPFSFPTPIAIIEERPEHGRQLCLWRLADLA